MPELEDPRTKLEQDLCIHIFTVSSAMVGVCLTVIGLLRVLIHMRKTDTMADGPARAGFRPVFGFQPALLLESADAQHQADAPAGADCGCGVPLRNAVEELDNQNRYQFGGVELSAKYRLLSPFKDKIGLALRLEVAYLWQDDVAGIEQEEIDVAPEIILHKNFLDDTLITHFNIGGKFAWGKKPAEEYDRELTIQGGLGVAYRFAPNWFIGVEGHWRSEFPKADFHEHSVIFVGPSLHYGAQKWWATLAYGYQVYGQGIDEPRNGKTYAEEARNEVRLKVGFNF